jgi:hypothetical protein
MSKHIIVVLMYHHQKLLDFMLYCYLFRICCGHYLATAVVYRAII